MKIVQIEEQIDLPPINPQRSGHSVRKWQVQTEDGLPVVSIEVEQAWSTGYSVYEKEYYLHDFGVSVKLSIRNGTNGRKQILTVTRGDRTIYL
ncbi:MAG: hypothetical protein KatS3mg023_0579 [Armatimonadota bacterium]|nr:MAG: hypothetical protein KatS3mg023_0579 [Armatimonadota bacterium]